MRDGWQNESVQMAKFVWPFHLWSPDVDDIGWAEWAWVCTHNTCIHFQLTQNLLPFASRYVKFLFREMCIFLYKLMPFFDSSIRFHWWGGGGWWWWFGCIFSHSNATCAGTMSKFSHGTCNGISSYVLRLLAFSFSFSFDFRETSEHLGDVDVLLLLQQPWHTI